MQRRQVRSGPVFPAQSDAATTAIKARARRTVPRSTCRERPGSRLQLPVILLILLLTLAACTRKADEVHEATLAAVTPGVISPTDELTVTGTGFYETDTAGLKVSVCGVQLQELRFSGEPRFIILPDGTRIEARVGNQLTGRVG